MKKYSFISLGFSLLMTAALLLGPVSPVLGQSQRIADFIKAGSEDAELLTKAYLEPLPNGLGGGLNTGWFNSASTHKTLGFDIQVRGALAYVPETDRTFDLSSLNLQKVSPADPGATITPTAGGANDQGPEVVVRDNGEEVARFNMPRGTGYHYVPSPMVQASVGLIKNTDLIVRYVPKFDIGTYGDFQMEGFGLKHELTQWLPASGFLPIDISVMAGYNRIDLTANLNVDPQPGAVPDPNYTGSYDNQRVRNSFDTFTAKLVVGTDLPLISLYGGLGYETSTMHLAVDGDYPVPLTDPTTGATYTQTVTDPFSYSEDGVNEYSMFAGFKLRLLFLHIFGEYTYAEYPVANAGVGISIR